MIEYDDDYEDDDPMWDDREEDDFDSQYGDDWCMDCGQCDWCIDRSIAAAEEMDGQDGNEEDET